MWIHVWHVTNIYTNTKGNILSLSSTYSILANVNRIKIYKTRRIISCRTFRSRHYLCFLIVQHNVHIYTVMYSNSRQMISYCPALCDKIRLTLCLYLVYIWYIIYVMTCAHNFISFVITCKISQRVQNMSLYTCGTHLKFNKILNSTPNWRVYCVM